MWFVAKIFSMPSSDNSNFLAYVPALFLQNNPQKIIPRMLENEAFWKKINYGYVMKELLPVERLRLRRIIA